MVRDPIPIGLAGPERLAIVALGIALLRAPISLAAEVVTDANRLAAATRGYPETSMEASS
jgi:hypothetical protein